MMLLVARARAIALFFAGLVLGGAGMAWRKEIATAIHSPGLAGKDNGSVAIASCVPQDDHDDIFFISCGGIY